MYGIGWGVTKGHNKNLKKRYIMTLQITVSIQIHRPKEWIARICKHGMKCGSDKTIQQELKGKYIKTMITGLNREDEMCE